MKSAAQLQEPALMAQLDEITVDSGIVDVYDTGGTGQPIVLVHGLLVNANLWRNVVPALAAAGFRVIVPNLPLGSHCRPMPDADLSLPGQADILEDLLDKLDLKGATLVANDTGGAIVQLLMTAGNDRVSRVVLTSCDCYRRCPPLPLSPLPILAFVPGATWLLTQALRVSLIRNSPFAFGWTTKRPISTEVMESYLIPSRLDPAIRGDLRRVLQGIRRRDTMQAARKFPSYTKPVKLIWAADDRLFPKSAADKLNADLPNSELSFIANSYTFVPEDQPEALADSIIRYLQGAPR